MLRSMAVRGMSGARQVEARAVRAAVRAQSSMPVTAESRHYARSADDFYEKAPFYSTTEVNHVRMLDLVRARERSVGRVGVRGRVRVWCEARPCVSLLVPASRSSPRASPRATHRKPRTAL